ncbi:hypothetical protein C8J57DRAFT_1235853 [Mycena rebaudengoi]|nr:hypothetical protein C8J57DRAFT_1235853 [Mycena rebaudengoi]
MTVSRLGNEHNFFGFRRERHRKPGKSGRVGDRQCTGRQEGGQKEHVAAGARTSGARYASIIQVKYVVATRAEGHPASQDPEQCYSARIFRTHVAVGVEWELIKRSPTSPKTPKTCKIMQGLASAAFGIIHVCHNYHMAHGPPRRPGSSCRTCFVTNEAMQLRTVRWRPGYFVEEKKLRSGVTVTKINHCTCIPSQAIMILRDAPENGYKGQEARQGCRSQKKKKDGYKRVAWPIPRSNGVLLRIRRRFKLSRCGSVGRIEVGMCSWKRVASHTEHERRLSRGRNQKERKED